MRRVAALLLCFGLNGSVSAQDGVTGRADGLPLTRAESSGYTETERFDDAVDLLGRLERLDDRMHLTTFGYSVEGRALPLVVYGDVEGADAPSVRASSRLRVFVMANIHAGEVCGKDAMLALLRDLVAVGRPAWADSVVLLVAPIYNADGNERISLYNRPRQHGPVAGMGRRENAQDLDLNRDHMKLASPEARSLVRLMNDYDPHVVVDLHTTNGSQHGYHVTYAAPMHPGTDPGVVDLLRNDWLPDVTRRFKASTGWDLYYYGNLPFRGAQAGWYTFDHRPRFNTNYVGLRNRIAILSEAYAYAPFRERVLATRAFVDEIVAYAHRNSSRIRAVVQAADRSPVAGLTQGVRAKMVAGDRPADILLGSVQTVRNPYSGETMFEMTDERRIQTMPEYGTFEATESVTAPAVYLVPRSLRRVVDLLHDHGIRVDEVAAPTGPLERFRIDSTRTAARPFQGVSEREVFGTWQIADGGLPNEEWVAVSIDQPLGRLAVQLLEPRSDDGFANWAVVDERAIDGGWYPVLRRPVAPAR